MQNPAVQVPRVIKKHNVVCISIIMAIARVHPWPTA